MGAEEALEKERKQVQRLTEKLSLLAVEKSELAQQYRQPVKDAGLRERAAPPAAAATRALALQQQIIRDAMLTDQRKRQLESIAALVTANARLRKQVSKERARRGLGRALDYF